MALSLRFPPETPGVNSWRGKVADAALLLIALFSGSLATYYAYKSSESARAQQVREQLSVISQSVIDGFYPDLLRSIEAVRATGLMVGTKRIQGRREFIHFAEAILANAPKISSLQWQPCVLEAQLGAFEAAARQDGLTDYHVVQQVGGALVPASSRPTYAPILYAFPDNFSPPGLDISFASQRMDSKLLAKKTRQPMASATLPLLTMNPALSGKTGFYISTAVFWTDEYGTTNSAKESLLGYVSGAIIVEDLFQESAFRSDAAYLEFRVYDQGSNSRTLIYNSSSKLNLPVASSSDDDFITPDDVRMAIDIGGQPWEVLLRPRAQFHNTQSSGSLSIAAFGCISTFLLLLGIYATQHSRRSISILQATTELTEQRLSRILDGTKAGTWEWHVPSGGLHVNEYWARMLGYTLSELSPINIDTWRNLCHPADLSKATNLLDLHLAGKIDTYDCELRMRHKDGGWVWVFARGSIISRGATGRMEWFAGTHMDISESKRVIQQMSDIRDALDAHAIVGITDHTGVITYVNDQFCNISGYSREELIGNNFNMLSSGQHKEDFFANLWLTIISGKTWKGEICDRTRDGSLFWLESTIAPILGDTGEPAQYIAINYDITEKKHHQEQLLKAKEVAESANRAKGDFLANMSHELRTPMNAILGLSNIISRTVLSIDQRECIRNLIQSGNLLLNIINDILDYSKIDAGRLELESVTFSLRQLLDAVSAVISANVNGKDIDILIGASTNIPDILIGDSLRLQQILINLVGNAIKFTEAGEIVVRVVIVKQDCDSIKLRFEVRDTGMGISPETALRLFTPFTQGDASTTRRFGGSGLGLAICGKLVRLMAGEIDVESKPGHGSTFWFTALFGLGNPQLELTEKRACCTNGDLSVLIVDDNPAARSIISDTIASLGWRTDCAEGGAEALEKLKAGQEYVFILVDWRMPGMDGLETIRAIRAMQTRNRVPVIAMVTAYDRDEACKADGGALVDNILVKPLTSTMIYDFVARNCQIALPANDELIKENTSNTYLTGVSILLVEDNIINQEVARRILELEHAKVTIASNGQEAIVLLQNCSTAYDVVLMDIQMPFVDGYEATRIIRSSLCLPDLPIIALTAGVMASDRQKAEAVGINGFVPKPFDVDFLVSTVAKYCGHHHKDNAPVSLPATEINPIFDFNDALRRAGGNRKLCRDLLTRFIEDFNSMSIDLPHLINADDASKVVSYIHLLRGVAGNIGARRLSEFAGEIECELRINAPSGSLSKIDQLMKLSDDTVGVISKFIIEFNLDAPSCTYSSDEILSLQGFRKLLELNDIEAIDALYLLKPSLATHMTDEQFERIRHAIDTLNFPTALKYLNEVIPDDR